VRLLVTALVLGTLLLAGCTHEKELKESPEQVAKEQAAADAHNAGTAPFAGDDETPTSDSGGGTTTTARVEYENVTALHVGDCVDLPTARSASVRPISCDKPHHAEVTARLDIGARFPNGSPTLEDFRKVTETDCRQAFDAYVRQPPPPGIGVNAIGPRAETWYSGFHMLICTADADREGNVLTGSVRKPA
jgi:Septum formation